MSTSHRNRARTEGSTPFEALRDSVLEAMKTPDGVEAPSVILWTDPEKQWLSIVNRLKGILPAIYTLGAYDLQTKTGPAIWIRCELDLLDKEGGSGSKNTPILYLPGIAKHDLRAGEDCPFALKPLVELQYRGRIWHQANGRDWTVEAFFCSKDEGLGVDCARDSRSKEAMLRALPNLLDLPLLVLRQKHWDADDFDSLLVRDKEGSLLLWMNDSEGYKQNQTIQQWKTFCDLMKSNFSFDVEGFTPADATQKLLSAGGAWEALWRRFQESPLHYLGIVGLLKESPGILLGVSEDRLPAFNSGEEGRLRSGLEGLRSKSFHEVVTGLKKLELEHSRRRNWVWAKIGESPLSLALERLVELAVYAESQSPRDRLQSIITYYSDQGYLCDQSALRALQLDLSVSDYALLSELINKVYGVWLDQTSRALQEVVINDPRTVLEHSKATSIVADTCYLFVDGLRYDLATEFKDRLVSAGYKSSLSARFAPFPTVTATAKPFAAPGVKDKLVGSNSADGFNPQFADGRASGASAIRTFLQNAGYSYIAPGEICSPKSGQIGAWVETGEIDELGHKLGVRLVRHLDEELDRLFDRVTQLFDAGWTRLRIVTDHGWLLLPGGLPKIELPISVAATKWSRCAVVQGDSKVDVPTVLWSFNSNVRIAVPWGVACFRSDMEYAHGGISLQESIVPELEIERTLPTVDVKFTTATWRGMRCRIAVVGDTKDVAIDLRTKWKIPNSSILSDLKQLGGAQEGSIVVADDKYEGSAATLVLIDSAGTVLDRLDTTVGGTQ